MSPEPYVDALLQEGREMDKRFTELLPTIRKVYEQQKYMFENKTHKVDERIVSITQPYVRPIVRGKTKSLTEFGAS